MARPTLILLAVTALLAFVLLGIVATEVGGISIRSASRTHGLSSLELANEALLPGVPVTVVINGEVEATGPVAVQLRLPTANLTLRGVSGEERAAGTFSVVLPCDAAGGEGERDTRLILVDTTRLAVLAQSGQLRLLPAGPDCVR